MQLCTAIIAISSHMLIYADDYVKQIWPRIQHFVDLVHHRPCLHVRQCFFMLLGRLDSMSMRFDSNLHPFSRLLKYLLFSVKLKGLCVESNNARLRKVVIDEGKRKYVGGDGESYGEGDDWRISPR